METNPKRKRSDNWVEEDKTLLKELVKERVSSIENKNTDTNTNSKKKRAWEDLEQSFNNLRQGSSRTISQLKSQWVLMKIQAKKEHAVHRREMNQTGGGPKPPDNVLGANDISVWLPQEFVIDRNEFDSDAAATNQNDSEMEIKDFTQITEDLSTTNVEQNALEENANAKRKRNEEECQEVEMEPKKKNTKKKRDLQVLSQNVANENIKKIADADIKNREELHLLQIKNENKRARNLDLQYKLIQENEERKARNLDLEYEILKNKKISNDNDCGEGL